MAVSYTHLDVYKRQVLEPSMNLKVLVNQKDMGPVIQDLTGARSCTILSIEEDSLTKDENAVEFQKIAHDQYLPPDSTLNMARLENDDISKKVINATAPLKAMMAYSNKLRSLTQGRGEFYMTYRGMEKLTQDRMNSLDDA